MKKISVRGLAKKVIKNPNLQEVFFSNKETKKKSVPEMSNKVIEKNTSKVRVRTLIEADDL